MHDLLSDPELLAAFQVGFCSPFIPWLKILHLLTISRTLLLRRALRIYWFSTGRYSPVDYNVTSHIIVEYIIIDIVGRNCDVELRV